MAKRKTKHTSSSVTEKIIKRLLRFNIEIPSWGFAQTGTRFGKYLQNGAAVDLEDKFADA